MKRWPKANDSSSELRRASDNQINAMAKNQTSSSSQLNFYFVALAIVVAIGVTSRLIQTGYLVFDKYLGDAIYAVMFYLILRIFFLVSKLESKRGLQNCLWLALVIVLAIEAFQLTGIPLRMRESGNMPLKIISIVLGTKFAFLDIVAYVTGLVVSFFGDVQLTKLSDKVKQ